MAFLSQLKKFTAGQRRERHRYQVGAREIEQIERLITDADFSALIRMRIPVTIDGRGSEERYALELVGACIAGSGNRHSQIRWLFNELKQIHQRVEARLGEASTMDLEGLKTELQHAAESPTDTASLLETLKHLIDRYETAETVTDEIELSLALVLSKLRYGTDKLRGAAAPFFENSLRAVTRTPTVQTFQSFIKAFEMTYAYFYPLASKED